MCSHPLAVATAPVQHGCARPSFATTTCTTRFTVDIASIRAPAEHGPKPRNVSAGTSQ